MFLVFILCSLIVMAAEIAVLLLVRLAAREGIEIKE